MNIEKLIKSVMKSEGFSTTLYKCPADKWTIGFGRNVESNGIRKDEALYMLKNDLLDIKLNLEDKLEWFYKLDDVRQNVLIEMAYNMGVSGLLKFRNTLLLINIGDFEKASKEMLNSKWHRDFQKFAPKFKVSQLRSSKLSEILRKGEY